jgi:hypothetical protein
MLNLVAGVMRLLSHDLVLRISRFGQLVVAAAGKVFDRNYAHCWVGCSGETRWVSSMKACLGMLMRGVEDALIMQLDDADKVFKGYCGG